MFAKGVFGTPYNKAQHNRDLQSIIDRPRGAIEWKYQNISAALKALGEDWLPGYKPRFNIQTSLVDAVVRWFDRHPEWLTPSARPRDRTTRLATREESDSLWIGPPPTQSNSQPPDELEQMITIARKYDVAERDARNRALGHAGEERVLAHEHATLRAAGRNDLADQIRWVSHLDGDGAGYDIRSFEADGRSRLIEVKTTNGWERTPFQLTRNELEVAESRREHWRLVRLWNFARKPRAFELRPPLEAHVSLIATNFQASLL